MSVIVTEPRIFSPFSPDTGTPVEAPQVPKEVLIEKLRQAIDLMNDGGKHWTKMTFKYRLANGEAAYCSIGAIIEAIGRENTELFNALGFELVSTLGVEPQFQWVRDPASGDFLSYVDTGPVIRFNDNPTRTWEEVKSLFESTIERLERKC